MKHWHKKKRLKKTYNFSSEDNPKKDPFLSSWILLLFKILQKGKKDVTQDINIYQEPKATLLNF